MDQIPALSIDLIDELDRRYPPMTAFEVLRLSNDPQALVERATSRSIVERLKLTLEQQQEDDHDV